MTSQDVYDAVYDSCVRALTPPLGDAPVVPVIRAYQDAQVPAGTYIAIDDAPRWELLGRHSDMGTDGTTQELGFDYEVTVSIWEGRGRGDHIRAIVENLSRRDERTLLRIAGLVVTRPGVILQVPNLVDKSRWHYQSKVEVVFGCFRAIEDAVASIAVVEVVGDVESTHLEQTIQI